MIATEYGWTVKEILDLTVGQLNLLIKRIGERLQKDSASQAIVLRMAIVAALSKEGAEAFNTLLDTVFEERSPVIVKPEDLHKFGLGAK